MWEAECVAQSWAFSEHATKSIIFLASRAIALQQGYKILFEFG